MWYHPIQYTWRYRRLKCVNLRSKSGQCGWQCSKCGVHCDTDCLRLFAACLISIWFLKSLKYCMWFDYLDLPWAIICPFNKIISPWCQKKTPLVGHIGSFHRLSFHVIPLFLQRDFLFVIWLNVWLLPVLCITRRNYSTLLCNFGWKTDPYPSWPFLSTMPSLWFTIVRHGATAWRDQLSNMISMIWFWTSEWLLHMCIYVRILYTSFLNFNLQPKKKI